MSKRRKSKGTTITFKGEAARRLFQVAAKEPGCEHDAPRRTDCPWGEGPCWCCDSCRELCGKKKGRNYA